MTSSNNSASSSLAKPHRSPSKSSSGRTYDSKLVSREMHRLGSLVNLSNSGTTSSGTMLSSPLTLSPTALGLSSNTSADSPWSLLHVHVLPLFNGEPLRIPVEDLNVLVKQHIQAAVSTSPSQALVTLEHNAADLIASGMVTLIAKLSGVSDDKLVSRVVEIWGFFWDQILPYIEGVLLPLHASPILSSLHLIATSPRTSDNCRKKSMPSLQSSSLPQIDVRTIAIEAFRDQVIFPIFSRLHACLTKPTTQDSFLMEKFSYQQPRLQQMLLVLVSQGRQRAFSLCLASPDSQPSATETAIQHLLQAIRVPLYHTSSGISAAASKTTPSFLSAGQPRDRRGRIGQKPKQRSAISTAGNRPCIADVAPVNDQIADGGETPKIRSGLRGSVLFDVAGGDYEREREFLESLRSPDPEGNRASGGGWGLGNWSNEDEKNAAEGTAEDEDDEMEWAQAWAAVEKITSNKSIENVDSRRPEERWKMI